MNYKIKRNMLWRYVIGINTLKFSSKIRDYLPLLDFPFPIPFPLPSGVFFLRFIGDEGGDSGGNCKISSCSSSLSSSELHF